MKTSLLDSSIAAIELLFGFLAGLLTEGADPILGKSDGTMRRSILAAFDK